MNNLTTEYGISFPIFNAGMAFVAGPELAASVTNAGGLGFIGAGIYPVPLVEAEYAEAKRLCDQQVLGIDFLAPFFSEEHLEFVLRAKPDVVAFFYGLPESGWLDQIKAQGTKIWGIVNTSDEAQAVADAQLHAVVLQGVQAGGHNRATEDSGSLLFKVRERLPNMPLIVAGGIVNGGDVRRALDAGAQGVWCGTVFLASEEANAHADYKQKVVECGIGETEISKAFGPEWPDEPMRVYQNQAVKALHGEATHPEVDTIGTSYIGGQAVEMPRYSVVLPMRDTEGDVELMALTMGSEAARVKSVRSVNDIMAELRSELAPQE